MTVKCPKCGGWTSHRYNPGHNLSDFGRKMEHLDYTCESCGFQWEADCLDVREARLASVGPRP